MPNSYDRRAAARELLSNRLLPDLFAEMRQGIIDQFEGAGQDQLPAMQVTYRLIGQLELSINNELHRSAGETE